MTGPDEKTATAIEQINARLVSIERTIAVSEVESHHLRESLDEIRALLSAHMSDFTQHKIDFERTSVTQRGIMALVAIVISAAVTLGLDWLSP